MKLRCLSFLTAVFLPLGAQTAPQPLAHPDSPASRVWSTLANGRDLVAAHPQDPARLIDLAYTLTDAGVGDEAREVARRAIAVAPNSAFTYSAAGWVLHHNSIGVDYGPGYSYTESFAALRKAVALDPGNLDVRQSLANSLEYNEIGLRYAPDAHLAEAIEQYRYVKAHQTVVEPQVENNLAIDLFYAGRFAEAAQEAAAQPPSPTLDGVAIGAIAALQGADAAIALVNGLSGDPQRRTAALNLAAEGLYTLRFYPEAAALLTAGIGDGTAPASTLAKIRLFTSLKRYQPAELPADDPRRPVQQLLTSAISGTLTDTELASLFTRNAYPGEEQWKQLLRDMRTALGMQQNLMERTGLPAAVLRDMVLGNMRILAEPGSGPGWPIDVQLFALPPRRFFVTRENGAFRIVASAGENAAIGNETLALLHEDNPAEACALLDWQRGQTERGDGDDPLGGPLLARFWTSGSHEPTPSIETAAISLLASTPEVIPYLPRLIAQRDSAPPGGPRTSLDLLVATAAAEARDSNKASAAAEALLRLYPASPTAIRLAGRADALRQDWTGWNAMLDARLAAHAANRDLLLEKAVALESQKKYTQAQATLRSLLDSGHVLPGDYNRYAWLSLFTGEVYGKALDAAQQASLGRGSDFASLHTLACIYAVLGRTDEARQTVLQAMAAANLVEPDSQVWFGFGLIYEQFGDRAAAAAAFKRVEKPTGPLDPVDTYVLAQTHLTSSQNLLLHSR